MMFVGYGDILFSGEICAAQGIIPDGLPAG